MNSSGSTKVYKTSVCRKYSLGLSQNTLHSAGQHLARILLLVFHPKHNILLVVPLASRDVLPIRVLVGGLVLWPEEVRDRVPVL